MRGLALTDADITHTIGLVSATAKLVQPAVRALQEGLKTIDVDAELDRGLQPNPPAGRR